MKIFFFTSIALHTFAAGLLWLKFDKEKSDYRFDVRISISAHENVKTMRSHQNPDRLEGIKKVTKKNIKKTESEFSKQAQEKSRLVDRAYLHNLNLILAAQIKNKLIYPARARRQRHEGTALVQFTVTTTGKVTNIEIISTSGSTILDSSARATIASLENLPLPDAPVTIAVPVQYQLKI